MFLFFLLAIYFLVRGSTRHSSIPTCFHSRSKQFDFLEKLKHLPATERIVECLKFFSSLLAMAHVGQTARRSANSVETSARKRKKNFLSVWKLASFRSFFKNYNLKIAQLYFCETVQSFKGPNVIFFKMFYRVGSKKSKMVGHLTVPYFVRNIFLKINKV